MVVDPTCLSSGAVPPVCHRRLVNTGYPNLTLTGFLVDNLVPVTIGNIIGGALMVGAVYWLIYLRRATT